jgi:hypothetical protein
MTRSVISGLKKSCIRPLSGSLDRCGKTLCNLRAFVCQHADADEQILAAKALLLRILEGITKALNQARLFSPRLLKKELQALTSRVFH